MKRVTLACLCAVFAACGGEYDGEVDEVSEDLTQISGFFSYTDAADGAEYGTINKLNKELMRCADKTQQAACPAKINMRNLVGLPEAQPRAATAANNPNNTDVPHSIYRGQVQFKKLNGVRTAVFFPSEEWTGYGLGKSEGKLFRVRYLNDPTVESDEDYYSVKEIGSTARPRIISYISLGNLGNRKRVINEEARGKFGVLVIGQFDSGSLLADQVFHRTQ